MSFVSILTSVMVVLTEEPENRNNRATKKNEEHLRPLVTSLVELRRDDLTAGDVDEGTAGKAHENRVDKRVALSNGHANQYTDRCC